LENFMAFQWMRPALLGLASAGLLLLSACGSGTIESQFHPSRAIAFGDAFSDAGQNGAKYTVNDGSLNWTQIVAVDYGISILPSASGGLNYATGNARVTATPDAAGNSATPTIQQQIDTFLASNTLSGNDLVMISGGYSDIIAQTAAVLSGAESSDQMLNNLKQAGSDLAAQAKRLVAAGATHVVVVGSYDLSKSPWAASVAQQALLSSATEAFNDALLVALADQNGDPLKMLYLDAALLFNQMVASPSAYTFTDVTSVACNSVDPGPGIGIGLNQVNSNLCSTLTIAPGITYTTTLFADAVYPTPEGQAQFGNYAFSRIHSTW